MDKRLAYLVVLTDLKKNPMFCGRYDARNGGEDFMYGISTVMENIAYHVGEKIGDDFSDMFMKNMVASDEKYNGKSSE